MPEFKNKLLGNKNLTKWLLLVNYIQTTYCYFFQITKPRFVNTHQVNHKKFLSVYKA
jgi:hypothetical protein